MSSEALLFTVGQRDLPSLRIWVLLLRLVCRLFLEFLCTYQPCTLTFSLVRPGRD